MHCVSVVSVWHTFGSLHIAAQRFRLRSVVFCCVFLVVSISRLTFLFLVFVVFCLTVPVFVLRFLFYTSRAVRLFAVAAVLLMVLAPGSCRPQAVGPVVNTCVIIPDISWSGWGFFRVLTRRSRSYFALGLISLLFRPFWLELVIFVFIHFSLDYIGHRSFGPLLYHGSCCSSFLTSASYGTFGWNRY